MINKNNKVVLSSTSLFVERNRALIEKLEKYAYIRTSSTSSSANIITSSGGDSTPSTNYSGSDVASNKSILDSCCTPNYTNTTIYNY